MRIRWLRLLCWTKYIAFTSFSGLFNIAWVPVTLHSKKLLLEKLYFINKR